MVYDATTLESFEGFTIFYGTGIFSMAAGTILIYVGIKNRQNHTIRKTIKKTLNNSTYGGIFIILGAIGLAVGLMLLLQYYADYTNPFYPLFSEAKKFNTSIGILYGVISLVAGLIFTIYGFIQIIKKED